MRAAAVCVVVVAVKRAHKDGVCVVVQCTSKVLTRSRVPHCAGVDDRHANADGGTCKSVAARCGDAKMMRMREGVLFCFFRRLLFGET